MSNIFLALSQKKYREGVLSADNKLFLNCKKYVLTKILTTK
ncbi:hypothetical protein RBY4I_4109 [Rhodobacterales bacterium Y4I]|nr:hypothetical protein RBY4I_4109 [Rhodobacterales bacterium Y4I]